MTVLEAARYVGFPCANGRAPNSFYEIAKKIGYRFHGRWLIARDDLDYARFVPAVDDRNLRLLDDFAGRAAEDVSKTCHPPAPE
jgi:hypothetical protein